MNSPIKILFIVTNIRKVCYKKNPHPKTRVINKHINVRVVEKKQNLVDEPITNIPSDEFKIPIIENIPHAVFESEKNAYLPGEEIEGSILFNLKPGELMPADVNVLIWS